MYYYYYRKTKKERERLVRGIPVSKCTVLSSQSVLLFSSTVFFCLNASAFYDTNFQYSPTVRPKLQNTLLLKKRTWRCSPFYIDSRLSKPAGTTPLHPALPFLAPCTGLSCFFQTRRAQEVSQCFPPPLSSSTKPRNPTQRDAYIRLGLRGAARRSLHETSHELGK